jgi:hypothetical protein
MSGSILEPLEPTSIVHGLDMSMERRGERAVVAFRYNFLDYTFGQRDNPIWARCYFDDIGTVLVHRVELHEKQPEYVLGALVYLAARFERLRDVTGSPVRFETLEAPLLARVQNALIDYYTQVVRRYEPHDPKNRKRKKP